MSGNWEPFVFIEADDSGNFTFVKPGPATASICPDPEAPHKCRRTYNDFCHQPCSVCGLTLPKRRPPGRVMVAHHRNPAEKKHSPSELSRRANKWWLVLVAELRKCEPLCATCHAAIHDAMSRHYDWESALSLAREDMAEWQRPEMPRE